jgi:mitochondrial ATPase complex subunit ATP10
LENKFVGYVYLVDWAGRIRWAGCGGPWNGDASTTVPQVTPATATAGTAIKEIAIKRPKEVPEGGISGQVSEGLVQGLGEVERLERCMRVLMNRLDSLVKEGAVS